MFRVTRACTEVRGQAHQSFTPWARAANHAIGRFLTYPTGDARSIASSGSGIAAKPLPKRVQKGDSRSCDGRKIALSDPAEACDRAEVQKRGNILTTELLVSPQALARAGP